MTHRIQIWTLGEPVPAALEARGRFFDMFERALAGTLAQDAIRESDFELVNVEGVTGSELPSVGSQDAVILTGSPAYVRDREPWVVRAETRTRELVQAGVPVLGVCFGHQVLGEALGGSVDKNPRGREIGTAQLRLTVPDPLTFNPEEDPAVEVVQMSHLDSIVRPPEGAVVLGTTPLEPLAAVRFAERAWGVQFHPEMDEEIIRHYLEARQDAIRGEGLDFEELLRSVREGGYGPKLLARFLKLLREGG